jgi:hypothetical protein
MMAVQTPGFLSPPRDQVAAARVLAAARFGRKSSWEKKFHSLVCVLKRRTLAKPLGFHFWTPSLRTAGRCSTAYESHAEPHSPIPAGLSVIRSERT